MRILYVIFAIALPILTGCNSGTGFPTAQAQQLASDGRRIIGNGDLRQPNFTDGGVSNFLTVTGENLDGREAVFVLNAATLAFDIVSRAETFLDQATGLEIVERADDDSDTGTPSRDGSLAAFLSQATNLLELKNTIFERRHVYLRDVAGDKNELISVGISPGPGNESRLLIPDSPFNREANADTTSAVMSADGRFITFATRATNIIPIATNGLSQIYVFDRDFRSLEVITWVVRRESDVFSGNGTSLMPDITTTGRYVVYESDATNLVDGDTNGRRDIFIFDRTERMTSRLNILPGGGGTLPDARAAKISENGGLVVFSAVPGPGDTRQIFLRNRTTGTTRLVSGMGGVPGNADSGAPSISPDGAFVVFQSDASNLVLDDTNGVTDVFVFSVVTAALVRVSVNVDGVQSDGESLNPSISPDNAVIAFVSRALNLVAPTVAVPVPPSRTLDLYLFSNPLR